MTIISRGRALGLTNLALEEDGRDLTSDALFPPDSLLHAVIVAKEDTIVAGLPLIAIVLDRMHCTEYRISLLAADGDVLVRWQKAARISAPARVLLKAERVIMNFIGHLSGVANTAQRFARAIEGTGVRILDTRKTTPSK